MLTREPILKAIVDTLQPLDYVHALWEGGAAAFGRVDEWSDIDLMIVADDECVPEAAARLDECLGALSPVELRFELPQPTWHGHLQVFYRLKHAGPFLLIDSCVQTRSSTNRFLQPELHGRALVHFDKSGVVTWPPFDADAHVAQIKRRLETLRLMFDLFQVLTLKELNRRNAIEAVAFYQNFTLRPLVEALRIQHDPARHNFSTRYVHYDLPTEIVGRLERLFFPANPDDLRAKFIEAQQFFWETIEQIDLGDVEKKLRATSKAG